MTKYEEKITTAEECERAANRAFAHGNMKMFQMNTEVAVALRIEAGEMELGTAEQETDAPMDAQERLPADKIAGMVSILIVAMSVVFAIVAEIILVIFQ